MTVRYEAEIAVDGDVESTCDYLADVSRWPEWAHNMLECRLDGATPLQAGSRIWQRVKMIGPAFERHIQATEVVRPERLAFSGTMGPAPMRFGYNLHPSGTGGTLLRSWVEFEPRGFLRFIAPLAGRRILQMGVTSDLHHLQAVLRTGSRRTPAEPRQLV